VKYGFEPEMKEWSKVLLAPPVPKKVIERKDFSKMVG